MRSEFKESVVNIFYDKNGSENEIESRNFICFYMYSLIIRNQELFLKKNLSRYRGSDMNVDLRYSEAQQH